MEAVPATDQEPNMSFLRDVEEGMEWALQTCLPKLLWNRLMISICHQLHWGLDKHGKPSAQRMAEEENSTDGNSLKKALPDPYKLLLISHSIFLRGKASVLLRLNKWNSCQVKATKSFWPYVVEKERECSTTANDFLPIPLAAQQILTHSEEALVRGCNRISFWIFSIFLFSE